MKLKIMLVAALAVTSLLAAAPAQAATFTVNDTGDAPDDNLGDNICDTAGAGVVCTLRAAIDEVNMGAGGHTIVIPDVGLAGPDTFTITGAAGDDLNVSGDYDISDSVTITGAGAGSTIIDGGGLDRVFDIRGAYTVSISGVTIQNGTLGAGAGGGINNSLLGALTLTNVTVRANTAATNGGGVYSNGASLTLTNSTIGGAAGADGNTATGGGGGGVFVLNGTLSVSGSTIRNNQAVGAIGGGIYDMSASAATVTNSTISDNTAATSAGGISMENALLTITDSTISGNTATGNQAGGVMSLSDLSVSNSTISGNTATTGGGGVYVERTASISGATISGNNGGTSGGGMYVYYNGGGPATTVTIDASTISGNTAGGTGGGGVFNNSAGAANTSVVTVTDTTISGNDANTGAGIRNTGAGATASISASTISGNTSGAQGGALRNDTNATAALTNTTISGNSSTASDGGGVYLPGGSLTFTNCTITNNDAATNSDGVYRTGGTLSFTNTIIAGNGGGDDCTGSYAGASNGSNLDSDNTCVLDQGSDLPGSTLANLGALASNGGSTQTHALLTGSAALDGGDNAACAAAPVNGVDQRAVARPQNGTCDIGAYEARPYTVTVTKSGSGSVADTNTVTGFDISCGATCTDTVIEGNSVTLTATPSGGYYFSRWSGACSGTANCALSTISANKNVTATFTAYPDDEPTSANTPPHYDGGGDDWLVWPAEGGSNIATSTGLIWKKLTDDEGDAISYETQLCDNFANGACVGEWTVAARVDSTMPRNALAGLGFGMAALAGFGLIRTRRGRAWLLALLLLTGGMAAASCGSSSSSTEETAADSRSCDGMAADEECQSVTGLSPETEYHWKVVAADSAGNQVESVARLFTTGK